MPFSVLLVEDNPSMQVALQDLFTTMTDVRIAGIVTTEMAASAWLQDNRGGWDLVVVDLLLDGGSGFHLLSRFKSAPGAGTVVVLSDFVTPAVAARCIELGADAVFRKADAKAFADYVMAQAQAQRQGAGGEEKGG